MLEWIFWESLSAVRSVRKTRSHHGFHFESVVEHYVTRGHHHLCLSHLRHLVLQYKSTPVHLSYAKTLMTELFRQFGAPGGLQPTHTSANSGLPIIHTTKVPSIRHNVERLSATG